MNHKNKRPYYDVQISNTGSTRNNGTYQVPRDSNDPIPNKQNQNTATMVHDHHSQRHSNFQDRKRERKKKRNHPSPLSPNLPHQRPATYNARPAEILNRPRPPSPQNHRIFDSWNSSSTGHQRADGKEQTITWRDLRTDKLGRQFKTGHCDDSSGPSMAFDGTCGSSPEEQKGEWRWVDEEEAKRAKLGVMDIRNFMGVSKRKAPAPETVMEIEGKKKKQKVDTSHALAYAPVLSCSTPISPSKSPINRPSKPVTSTSLSTSTSISTDPTRPQSRIFAGTAVYVNGSTMPQISDHRLKHLLVSHGARISTFMARKTVSHIIIGQPGSTSSGAGGGLSARKLQQEIERGGWKGIKVVGVDWALQSINAGKRLSESRFAVLNIAPQGQRSVLGMLLK
ncbi:uncharacterized protein N7477_004845 [Penicillium maclennaniae]|uniref:uncharacterized protein n=1 Tax=Penicillium maclennaniae TaxID=1343394 RepID=UPI0025416C33|nr:uncharacterized protein N7477_004845 [Penicillium maclennaniae]KAJ5674911.1 hypothetical protein N7477_004845 [Penicillium maclennaniae]